jgi:hypothetical protein
MNRPAGKGLPWLFSNVRPHGGKEAKMPKLKTKSG